MLDLNEILRNPYSRRAFLSRMTAAGFGIAAVQLLEGCGGVSPKPGDPGTSGVFDPVNFPGVPGRSKDEVALNYGLTLELLRADLYRQALNRATGRLASAALDATLPTLGTTGAYTQTVANGSIMSSLAPTAFRTLVQFAYTAAAHRDFLDAKLQAMGAPRATANTMGYAAPLGNDLSSILTQLHVLEERSSSAYLGVANHVQDPALITTTAAFSSSNARNAASLAYFLGRDTNPAYNTGDQRITDSSANPYPGSLSAGTFSYYRSPQTTINDIQSYIIY